MRTSEEDVVWAFDPAGAARDRHAQVIAGVQQLFAGSAPFHVIGPAPEHCERETSADLGVNPQVCTLAVQVTDPGLVAMFGTDKLMVEYDFADLPTSTTLAGSSRQDVIDHATTLLVHHQPQPDPYSSVLNDERMALWTTREDWQVAVNYEPSGDGTAAASAIVVPHAVWDAWNPVPWQPDWSSTSW